MKKFLAGFITAVALSFFVFPVGFTFLPSALNSKMIMAGWGLAVFVYRCIRERRVEIPRIVLISGMLAALFSLWCLIAVTLAETYDMEYVSYIKSFFTWVLGALGACAVMKFCTGKDDLPTLTKYLAVVSVSQCILALLFENVPFIASLHISHSLHGSPSCGFRQFIALAKIFAADVFPVPRPPVNK